MSEWSLRSLAVLAGAVLAPALDAAPLGLGTPAAPDMVAARDYAVGPRGEELPAGGGSARDGARIYSAKCAACHGPSGDDGPDMPLVGGQGSLAGERPRLTVGSYWPYATTLFDYIRRAMPFTAPGSLDADETYALTAYLLAANGIIASDASVDRASLPTIAMPNRAGFVPDDRPDTR